MLFLSHWHWDHSGGITTVVAAIAAARSRAGRPPLVVDVHPDRPDQRGILTPFDIFAMLPPEPTIEAIEAAGGRVVTHADVHAVADLFLASGDIPRQTSYETGLPATTPGAATRSPSIPSIHDERFLAANVRGRGTTVLTACSHAGVVNVGLEARRLLPDQPVDLLLGGYHLAGTTVEDRIEPTVRDLTDLVAPSDRRPRALHRLASRRRTRQRIQPDRLRAERRRHPLPAPNAIDRARSSCGRSALPPCLAQRRVSTARSLGKSRAPKSHALSTPSPEFAAADLVVCRSDGGFVCRTFPPASRNRTVIRSFPVGPGRSM